MYPDSDSDASTRDDSRSINLLESPPKSVPSLQQQRPRGGEGSTDGRRQQGENGNGKSKSNNDHASPASCAADEESVVSPATQTINQLSQTNQSTSLHYDMSQLEHDVAKTLAGTFSLPSPQAAHAKALSASSATASSRVQRPPPAAAPALPLQNSSSSPNEHENTATIQLQRQQKITSTNTVPFLRIDKNFSLYKIEITSPGTLGLTITRARPPDDLMQSLEHCNKAMTQGSDNYNDNNDDDATVDEGHEGLENACYVELVRDASLAASFGIMANDWFVQMAAVGGGETNHQSSSTGKISFFFYNDVRTKARQTQRPITFLVARRNNSNNNKSYTNPAPLAPSLLMTRPTQLGSVMPAQAQQHHRHQQQQQQRGATATVDNNSSKTLAAGSLESRQETFTKTPQQQASKIGLKNHHSETAEISMSATATLKSRTTQNLQGKKQTLQAPLERPQQVSENAPHQPARQVATSRKDINNSKSCKISVPKSGPSQNDGGKKQAPAAKKQAPPARGTQQDLTADDHVLFCIKCNSTGKKPPTIHHAWCPKHGQFHNSGADVILERLRMGMRLGCPTCTKELESGRLFVNASHTQACMKNQERLKSSSANALNRKKESLDNNQKASSSKGKRKSSNHDAAKKSSSMSRKKKKQARNFSDTSSSSSNSEDELQDMQPGRKISTRATKRRRRATTRPSSDYSDDDSDESMYMDDSHGNRRRPMQTLLALKKQKQRKDSGAYKANRVTPYETATRVGRTESVKNRNANDATAGNRRVSCRFNDEGHIDRAVNDDNDDDVDGCEPLTSVWEIDDNPWGPEGHMDGDVVLHAPQIDMGNCDMLLPSNRYKSDPFSANSQYCKTHRTPSEGYQLFVLKRDVMARSSWGFSCYLHEFGGACLVKRVDPLSPADTASFAGHSGSNGTELGLRPNDMIVAVNGKLTGGMGEVELQVAFDTAVCELYLVVSRYKFPHQRMDKIQEAERSLLAAVDDAMNDEHLLGWTDVGNCVTAESIHASGCAILPSRDESLREKRDGIGNATGGELEQPSNSVDKMPSGNFAGATEEQDETLRNDGGVSHDKSNNAELDTGIAATTGHLLEQGLPAASTDCLERMEDPSERAPYGSANEMGNGETNEYSSTSRDGDDRPSIHPLDTENPTEALEEKSEKDQSAMPPDDENPLTLGPLACTLRDYASTSTKQNPFCELSQEISTQGSHDSAIDDEDDGNAWCGCVCGFVHPKKVPVYWIQCGACMSWYNVSKACVGFDCHHAKSIEHWECWACKDPDESTDEATEQECTNETILPGDAQQHLTLPDEQQAMEVDLHDRNQPPASASEAALDFTTTAKGTSDQQPRGRYSNRSVDAPDGEQKLVSGAPAVGESIHQQMQGASRNVSNGKYIPPDRRTEDGCILPKSKPKQRPDGTFIRVVGPGIAGFHWDEIRGVFQPVKKRTTAMGHPQKKSTTGKQRGGDGCRSQRSQSSSRLRPRRRVSAESASTSSPDHNPEEGIDTTNNNSTLDVVQVLNEGDHVLIKEHAWPGVDNPEGIAVVLKSYIDEDGDRLYDVKYVVGRKRIGILAQFVSRHVFS